MSRLHLQQTVPPLSLFGHKIQDPFPVAHSTLATRQPARNADLFQHPSPPPRNIPAPHIVTMHIAVDATDVMQLRQLAATVCGDKLASIRVQPIAQAKRMNVWLSLEYDAQAADMVMVAIMRQLPRAQFGHFNAV